MLIEDNLFHDLMWGTEIKADMPRFTYRHNVHYGILGRSIGGNMHSLATSGEILFNLVNAPASEFGLDVNQDGEAKRIDIYRNTFVSRVRVRNTDAQDGPFRFYNNVIVNGDSGTPNGSHIYFESVSAPSVITSINNLAGYPNASIVNSSGLLTSSYQQYLGTHGYELSESEGSPPPSPPTNIIVE
jgi:hypothetical protein